MGGVALVIMIMHAKEMRCYEMNARLALSFEINNRGEPAFIYSTVVTVPRECRTGEVYWIERIVPIVNKKYVEMRSNLNSAIRKIYQSMISCITGFCGC